MIPLSGIEYTTVRGQWLNQNMLFFMRKFNKVINRYCPLVLTFLIELVFVVHGGIA